MKFDADKIRNMTADELQAKLGKKFGKRPRIINAFDNKEVKVGDVFTLPPHGAAALIRLDKVVVHGEEIGIHGIVSTGGREKRVPMPYRWDHPGFPNELVLFIPT